MSVDYTEIAASATEMLAEYGVPVVLTRPGDAEYDPASGEVEASPSEHQGVGVRTDYSLGDIDGTLIQRGDVRILLGASLPLPKSGDHLRFAAETYRVINADVVQPAAIPVLYVVQGRR